MSVGAVDETGDEDALDAITGGGEEPDAERGGLPGGDLDTDQLMTAATTGEPGGEGVPEIETGGDNVPASGGASNGASAGFPSTPTFDDLQPAPPPPQLTNDPAENTRRLVEWQRALTSHQGEVTKRQAALQVFAAKVGAAKGSKEAQLAAERETAVKLAVQQARERRERAQAAVDQAVQDRLEAKKSLESFKWERPHDGHSIAAIILGGLASGLGNASAAQLGQVGHFENEAIKDIDMRMKRDYDAKKAKYAAAGDALLMAKYGVTNADTARRAAMNDLDADFSARYKRVAAEAESVLKQQGVPEAQAKGNAMVLEANQKAAAHEEQIHQREEQMAASRSQANATLNLARANLGERRREFDEGRANRESDRKDKAAEKKASEDAKVVVRDASGAIRGSVSTPRNVKAAEDRLVQYDDAIKSAKDLLAYRKEHNILGALPTGDAYDRAVLAVAATTQANASDATTAHEAGTLKKMGLVDEKAIEKTIEHLEARQAAFLRQLNPAEGEIARPAAAGEKAAPSRGETPPAKAGALTDSQAATLLDHLKAHPDDPRAARIKQRLRDAGYGSKVK